MSDNPMYWPGHQRPAWHQQPAGAPQPVNTMSHYAGHPGQMLSNLMVPPGMPPPPGADPSSLQVQSNIPGARPSSGSQQQQASPLGPAPPSQSSIYTTMMPPSGPNSARPSAQLNSTNSHLASSATQNIPPPGPHQTSLQQQPPSHPQSHYPHQYSSLAPSYWNTGSINSQPGLGPSSTGASGGPPSGPPGSQSDAASAYHSSSASPLTMPNDSRGGMSNASASSFLSPKDIQSSNDHMMSYDRQRGSMPQQPHPSAMMSQNAPSSTASNLSPNPNQVGMQRQPPMDPMRSMSQQPTGWTNSYYGAPSQSPYVNPYMPYGGSSVPTNHSSALTQAPRPPPSMTQKVSINGSDRTRGVYPTHSSIYGQPPPPTASSNGGYYGYDPYYNQVASQPPSADPYLSHPSSASQQHWPASASGQMISNSSGPLGPPPPTIRPQAGATGSSIHPQSPSDSSSLPSITVRPTAQTSQSADRSPASAQHTASYPSPNQQGSTKSTSNSLAQLEQMVMPNSGQGATPSTKSPTHRSSTSSPSTNPAQQQMQYSYNSSGGSYFTSAGSGAPPNQSNYYSQYDASSMDVPKSSWNDPSASSMPAPGPVMIDSGPSGYGQSGYDSSGFYGDYTTLSAPSNSIQAQYVPSADGSESQQAEKSDPYAIDSQTFDDYDDPTTVSKAKKSRAKKGDDSVKKERKPRAPKASKTAGPEAPQPLSPQKSNSSVPEPANTPSTVVTQVDEQQPNQAASSGNFSSSESMSTALKPISDLPAPQYNQYDSSSSDPNRARWQDPSHSPNTMTISGPSQMIADSNQPSFAPGQYDNSNSYSEYTTLSAPSKTASDSNITASVPSDAPSADAPSVTTDGKSQETQDDQASKSKKSKSKKGDESTKRERKPRAPKGAKVPNSGAQPSSPSVKSSTPIPQSLDPPFNQDQSAMAPSGAEASMIPNYIPSQTADPKHAGWNESGLPGHVPAPADGRQLYVPPAYISHGYPEYHSTIQSAGPSQLSQSLLPDVPKETSDATTSESQVHEGKAESTTPKPKKSRAKRSDDRSKKERKPRAAKTPQPQPPTTDFSLSPNSETQADLSITESQASQPTSDGTPSETKPKRIRVRDPTSKGKKKLPKFALKFAKTKKRKRLGSSDNDQSDLDKTPPPSPDEAESGIQKRRSARNTKKLKYNEDIELGFSESDDDSQPRPRSKKITQVTADGESMADETVIADEPTVFAAPVEDTMVVEKIMASRTGTRELEPEPGEVLPPDGTHIEVEEFYVKYKNLSYLHCDWRTLEELEKGDRRVSQKIKRYKQKKDGSNLFSFMDEDLFDPQYCEVDRILAVNEVEELVPADEDEETKLDVPEVNTQSDDKLKPTVEDGATSELSPKDSSIATDSATADTKAQIKAEVPDVSSNIVKQEASGSELTSNGQTLDEAIPPSSGESEAPAKIEGIINGQASRSDDKLEITEVDKVARPTTVQAIDNDDKEAEKPKIMKKKISRHYLVKWRGLSYEDSTWELEDALDPDKIKHFERFKDPPPKSKWKPVKRPKPEEWVRREESPIYKNNNTLREYQLEGINWLSFCWHQGRNCILADEMGLGKTIQSIAFINEIYKYGIYGPFLIIVPLSTVGNWAREFETWTDLNVITYHGSSTSREMLKEYEMFYRNEQGNRITSYYKFQVMITTFEIILSDCLDLREIPWRCCIIDEAHRLKNRNCKLLEGLRLLNMEHRVLLTGTPLQNNVEELFSLLNFLEPTQFSSTEQFLQEFGDLKTEAQVDKLKLILKPMMLRRLKEDVEKTLAPKEETIVEVELTNIQKKYYRAILEKNFSFLSKGSTSNNMPNLMNTMMELRKCCIHPYLINGAEEQIMYEAKQSKMANGEPMSAQQAMVNSSGKLVLIDKLLPRLRADGHRVLIFSQMVRCLDILEDYVTHKHYPYERIDGRVRGSERQQAIDRFSKPGSDRFVFLLCTRAGGLGINLTAADTVIIFDSDWNPQNDLQAQARCHRIGQSKAVKIYRLICRNTYEREMFDKASLKLGLDKAVLQSMNTQKGGSGSVEGQLTKKEIEELLRKGAYGALMDDDNAGDKFCEEDIDQILQRRTQVITIDNSEAKGSTFSKATFSSSNNREDIELDDPNFWEKWAKKANIDSDEFRKEELIQLAPRRRTQTKRYGADGNLIDMSDLESSEEDEETISMRTRGSRSGRLSKMTPTSAMKKSKRSRYGDYDEDFALAHDGGFWSKNDCLKVENGLLTYGWGRWDEIIASSNFKRPLTADDCESISRAIILYCLNAYKGDEKIKSFAWELITPPDNSSKSESDSDATVTTRGRKPKSSPIMSSKRTVADEIAEAKWTMDAKNDPLIALPDDQYRRHLQRNCNRLLIRVKFLHYLKYGILKDLHERIMADCSANEIDLMPCPVDGDLPAIWWDEDADKSLLIGIFKHGHDKFNLIRQDPNLCFLSRCGPPNKEDLMAELRRSNRNTEYFDDEFSSNSKAVKAFLKTSPEGEFLDELLNNVVKDLGDVQETVGAPGDILDENKNTILKAQDQDETMESCENGIAEVQTKMDITDDESSLNDTSIDATIQEAADLSAPETDSGDLLPFPSPNDLNQRFRRLITAYQRNSKKLEIKLAQKVRDELKKERNSKFEAAKNEREERKRSLAQKWSRREEGDFSKAISFFGVDYIPNRKCHEWNKFRSIGKLDKKLDETLEEYYKAFVVMCKRVTCQPLTLDEERCPINVEMIPEDRASRCLARIEFFSKIREKIIHHPKLDQRLKLCQPQPDLPDWWVNGKHDRDLLIAASRHGLYRLDYNLAFDPTLSYDKLIRYKVENFLVSPPPSILIALDQLQELLDRNGIEYVKDHDQDGSEDIKLVVDSLLDTIEADEQLRDEINLGDKSLLSAFGRAPLKSTRSSAALSGFSSRLIPNILSRRSGNTLIKSSSSSPIIRLTSNGDKLHFDDSRVVEVTPILPDKVPTELKKSHEAGELTVTLYSESVMLRLDDREPIILNGATHPLTVKIRWPKDKALQTRLENLIYLVERNEWPSLPKPSIPTITLPNHLASASATSTPLSVTTSSPSKSDKYDQQPLGSPKSDISTISSRASRNDTRDDFSSNSRSKKGRGRRPRQGETDPIRDFDQLGDDRQAAAKLRNLLSQGSSSSRGTVSDRTSKFATSKQGSGLSSLLAPSKSKRSHSGANTSSGGLLGASTGIPTGIPNIRPDDLKNLLNLNVPGVANLLPQILANMKPEFRDLLANQDTAQLLLNSLTGLTAPGGIASSLRSNTNLHMPIGTPSPTQSRSSSKSGPPPAHQPPSAHSGSSSSTRELRRSGSQHTREASSPPSSINLRSTRGKVAMSGSDVSSHQKTSDNDPNKTSYSNSGLSSSKRRGRPASSASDSPPGGLLGADILDLSSLPPSLRGAAALSRHDSRLRRQKDNPDESLANISTRSSSSATAASRTSPKDSPKGSGSSQKNDPPSPDKGRTTRASKRIGSRIDALALNLQAKKLHRSGSPSSELSPTLPKDQTTRESSPQAAHGGVSKTSTDHKSRSPKAPPAAHSGHHKPGSSGAQTDQQRDKHHAPTSQPQIPTNLLPQTQSTASTARQDPLTQLMANSASLLAGLNPSALGNAGDFMNQLLRKAGTNDMVKNLLNELMKNPSLALDPNILATLTATLPLANQGLPGFTLPTSAPLPTSLPSSSSKNSASSLLNDFKPPSGSSGTGSSTTSSNQSKRSRHDAPASTGSSRPSVTSANLSDGRRSSTSSAATATVSPAAPTTSSSSATSDRNMFFRNAQQQAANAALANSLMNLASQPNTAANPYSNYTNPLANPFLPFGLANLGMNNPLGMGLFPNLYGMPPGFPTTATNPQQQQQQSTNQSSGSTEGGAKDKKMRYPRK